MCRRFLRGVISCPCNNVSFLYFFFFQKSRGVLHPFIFRFQGFIQADYCLLHLYLWDNSIWLCHSYIRNSSVDFRCWTCFPLAEGGTVKGGLHSSGLFGDGNWNMVIPAPWKEHCDVVELGLWSRLSKAPTVNRPLYRQTGDTTPSSWDRIHIAWANQSSSCKTRS